MGIATYILRLAARNTPSGSPRFLALPVLTLPFNRSKSCLLRRRPPTFDDEAHAVRAIASVSLSVSPSPEVEDVGSPRTNGTEAKNWVKGTCDYRRASRIRTSPITAVPPP
jgi:hypothetical protein